MKKMALLFALLIPAAGLHAQTFNLQTGREPVASLDGLWRFHTGDNPAWASPNFDDSQWPLLRSDESWTQQGYPGVSGYAWYRFTLQVPDGSKPISLLLTGILTGYQVYANGRLIGSEGSTAPTSTPTLASEPKLFRLPISGVGPQTIQIAVRVWSFRPYLAFGGPLGNAGTLRPGNAAGDTLLLLQRLQAHRNTTAVNNANTYAYCLITALVGITILVLFLFRPADREYLWFAIYILAAGVAGMLGVRFFVAFPLSPGVFLYASAGAVSVIAGLVFFSIVLRVRRSWLWWVACVTMALDPFGVALTWLQWTTWGVGHVVGASLMLPAYFWIMVTLTICAYKKDESARLLLAPTALLYAFTILIQIGQITDQLGWPTRMDALFNPILSRPYPLLLADVINYIFMLALLIFLVRRFSLARKKEERLSTEFEAARSIQRLLIPANPPATPGFSVETVYLPASEVGGDFFYIQPADDDSLLIVFGDVSGKGLKAAMTVSAIIGALRNEPSRRPATVLHNLNRILHGNVDGFATCAAALITADGAMIIANAGNPAPYRNGQELAVNSGLPLGIVADVTYEESHYDLAPNDRLTFVSDGVIEATNPQRELFGFDRTQAISTLSAHAIAEAAKQFGQQDDISVLRIERQPVLETA